MHLHSFDITNIRSIAKLDWEAPVVNGSRAGWHVIIGDNGAGKSTLLRAVALGLMGQKNWDASRQDWTDWLANFAATAETRIALEAHPEDEWTGTGRKLKNYYPSIGIRLKREVDGITALPIKFRRSDPSRHIWGEKAGWFSASFGPFRRFTGGDKDAEKLFYSHPRLARHLSVLGEDIALTECLSWLKQLRFEQLDRNSRSGKLLLAIRNFVNQEGFLPHRVTFDRVDSKSVRFVDGNKTRVSVNLLGDGFRSILSLTFELLRQMTLAWPTSELFDRSEAGTIFVKHSGVVMIDEIDAHLHPTWQRRIGFWLTKHFPNVQFIVTTHSPLVCHAAEKGSIFRLPTPGADETARMVTGLERDRLIFGSVLDAYGTDLFGVDVSRSDSAKGKQRQLAALNQKALSSVLTPTEARERAALQKLFPASM